MTVGTPSQLDLVRHWDCSGDRVAVGRLDTLLARCTDKAALSMDTPGMRNRRHLLLHRQLVGREMEAQAQCPQCATMCEFMLPISAMLDSPAPDSSQVLEIEEAGTTYRFRLPTMEDIGKLDPQMPAGQIGRVLAEACQADKSRPLPDRVVARLNQLLDEVDPLATPLFDVHCSDCGHNFSAAVELASFVAREFDTLFERLLRDVHGLARAYGWGEAEILAIPPARRARYLAMISQTTRPARPVAF